MKYLKVSTHTLSKCGCSHVFRIEEAFPGSCIYQIMGGRGASILLPFKYSRNWRDFGNSTPLDDYTSDERKKQEKAGNYILLLIPSSFEGSLKVQTFNTYSDRVTQPYNFQLNGRKVLIFIKT